MDTHHHTPIARQQQQDVQQDTIDPVCGMTVDPEQAAGTSEYHGRRYFFCSTSCLERFQADPEQYTRHQPTQMTHTLPHAPTRGEEVEYTCPMHPEVRQQGPGACPTCGMALEPTTLTAPMTQTEYTCPMHPEIVRQEPGFCPICGMALEPRTVTVEEEANPELVDMTRRFWVSLGLTLPLLIMAMADMITGVPVPSALPGRSLIWLQLALATPVVLWGGWSFFQRGWASLVNRSLNMFTLIAIGVGTAYGYSVVGTLFPDLFPHTFRAMAARRRYTLRRRRSSRRWSSSAKSSSSAPGVKPVAPSRPS